MDECLLKQLRQAATGATVHTVNKAIFHYGRLSQRKDKRLLAFEERLRMTLATGDWAALAHYMRRWW